MATRIRLKRMGAKKAPFYRVVVADSRSPRDGRFIEEIGYYDPTKNPSLIKIDEERAKYWISIGALPSDTVRSLMVIAGVIAKGAVKGGGTKASGEAVTEVAGADGGNEDASEDEAGAADEDED